MLNSSNERLSLRQEVIDTYPGAIVTREIHCAHRRVGAHRHDWPSIILPIVGDFAGETDDCTGTAPSACAAVHPAFGAHAAVIGWSGLDAINIMFDPDWIRTENPRCRIDRHVACWGASAVRAARRVMRLLLQEEHGEEEVASAIAALLNEAFAASEAACPDWVAAVEANLTGPSPASTVELASELGLHPAWLAQAYRAATGVGLRERRMRRRIERAAFLLRHTDDPLSGVAVEAGFCDQSHMSRCVRELLGRTPLQARNDLRASPIPLGASSTT